METVDLTGNRIDDKAAHALMAALKARHRAVGEEAALANGRSAG